ncbi:MAG: NUDIX domain-containing protein [Firmicutes bacterium]|nr:NUDIX domain-containing protein [Bacillota bacterium]
MNPDMVCPCGDGYVNIRVGALIIKDGRLLLAGNPSVDYLYTVGGRIKFGESAEQAVAREVFEETGVRMEPDRLAFIQECYFICDCGPKTGKPVYELGFYYFMKTPDDFEPACMSFTEDGNPEQLQWVSPGDPYPYYPEFCRTELVKDGRYTVPEDRTVKHFFSDDR